MVKHPSDEGHDEYGNGARACVRYDILTDEETHHECVDLRTEVPVREPIYYRLHNLLFLFSHSAITLDHPLVRA